MKSETTDRFRKAISRLPDEVQQRARKAYWLWKENNNHPGLHFKQVHKTEPIYSVRIGLSYRALGIKQKIVWSGFGLAHMKSIAIWFQNFNPIFTVQHRLTSSTIFR